MKFTEDQLIEMMDANGGTLDLSKLPITELPDNLIIPGSVILHSNLTLEAIPDGLTVLGSLDLRNSAVKEIGEQVRVGGNLYTGSSAIERIGKYLRVERSFYPGELPLEMLPEDLFVGEDLNLEQGSIRRLSGRTTVRGTLRFSTYSNYNGWRQTWPALEELPAELTVGKLYLVEEMHFASEVLPIEIPADITVLDKLVVSGYRDSSRGRQQYVVLPEGLTIDGDFFATGIPIPRNLTVGGSCRFKYYPEEPAIVPPDLVVQGNLNLEYYTPLKSIPGTVEIGGNLLLPHTIRTLGAGLTVGGNLTTREYYSHYSTLEPVDLEIHPGVKIGGSLKLGNIQKIACLPDDMEIGGGIVGKNIGGLPESWDTVNGDLKIGPAKLPDGLKYIYGDLRVPSWGPRDALPAGLTIDGNLSLSARIEMPRDLVVLGDIYLYGYPIDELPEGLQLSGELSIGVDHQGNPCLEIRTPENFLKMAHLIENLPEHLEVKSILANTYITIGNRE